MISIRIRSQLKQTLSRLSEINSYRTDFSRFLSTNNSLCIIRPLNNRLNQSEFVLVNKRFNSSEPPVTNEPKQSVPKKQQINVIFPLLITNIDYITDNIVRLLDSELETCNNCVDIRYSDAAILLESETRERAND
jgi:hypothetical protein